MNWFLVLCNITFVNLILSGDNALAISLAAGKLPGPVRKKAIIWGSIIAILLLLLFIAVGTYIMELPVLKSVAGGLLLWVGIHLVLEHIHHSVSKPANSSSADGLWKAILTIAIADLVMSLDNAVAMLGVANGRIGALMVSLVITIPFLIFGSHFIAAVLQKFSWIVYVAATYIAYLSGTMIADDPVFRNVSWNPLLQWIAPVLCLGVFGLFWMVTLMRRNRSVSIQNHAVSPH